MSLELCPNGRISQLACYVLYAYSMHNTSIASRRRWNRQDRLASSFYRLEELFVWILGSLMLPVLSVIPMESSTMCDMRLILALY